MVCAIKRDDIITTQKLLVNHLSNLYESVKFLFSKCTFHAEFG